MQNPVQLGSLVSAQMDALGKSGERFENKVRAAQNSGQDQPEALKKVAQEFESLFISYLLKVMRETIEESGLTEGGFGKGIYTDLFDQELSRSVAQTGGLGISDMIYRRIAPEITQDKQSNGIEQPRAQPATQDKKETTPEAEPESDIPDVFLPVAGPVSSNFGLRRDPFDGHLRFHKGMDLAAPAGTAVQAPWGGTVISTGFEAGYGSFVVMEHPEGFKTRYAHLEGSTVRKGDVLTAGEELGTVGCSGRSTGPHLHFEVMKNGDRIDPRAAFAD